MNKNSLFVFSIVISAVVAFAVSKYVVGPTEAVSHKETAYERVIRTGTLKCGYEFWDGGFMQDPKTNELHGPWKDFLEEFGRIAKIKIEWSDHVGWGQFPADLKSGKMDAMCAGVWQDAVRAKEIALSVPMVYTGLEAFTPNDEHRFDGNLKSVNSPDVNIMVIEGDTSDFIAQQDFPLAKRVPLGTLNATDSDLFMSIGAKKADVTFDLTGLWRQYDKINPGKVRRIDPGHYLKVIGVGVAFNNEDLRLQQLVNVGIAEMMNSGAIDRILKKYETDYPDMFMKSAPAYVP